MEESQIIGDLPNKTARRLLATEWKTLSEEKRLVLRAARARRGIKCDICGTVGYYRENCVNGCVSPPKTPDSLASTPPASARKDEPSPEPTNTVGLFWGSKSRGDEGESERTTFYKAKQKVQLSDVRPHALKTLAALQESDQKLGSFAFYKRADHGYARDYAELTLHQVMRRIMRLLEKQLQENIANLTASFDTTLLHPPSDQVGDNFYPPQIGKIPEYQDYFIKKVMKNKSTLNYRFQGATRPLDDLDSMFRGGDLNNEHLYTTKPNAGESIHAKNTWKSILARHDTLANSDPALARKQEQLDKLFKDQSQWIAAQQKSMQFRNDRFEHLVHILKREIEKEHARDAKLLSATNRRVQKSTLMEVWTERLASVDNLILVLQSYRFTAGLEEADFLLYCLEKWKETSQHEVMTFGDRNGQAGASTAIKANRGGQRDLVAASTNPYYPDTVFLAQYVKKNARIYEKSKSGQVFTAERYREVLAAKEVERQEQICQLTTSQSTRSLPRESVPPPNSLPSMEEIIKNAQVEAKQFEEEEAKRVAMMKRYHLLPEESSLSAAEKKQQLQKKYHLHPREADALRIKMQERSFRRAGLGTRIRKGIDTDPAHALPALIPIPKAFDGDSRISSYAAENIVFGLKKQMVLSDIGYTPQLAVPLYVRNTLEEKEGTSLHGDPTKEELAQDRRYSHYLGRPLVRFNPSVTLPEHLSSHATGLEKDESKSPRAEAQTSSLTEPVLDLSALTLSTKERAAQQQKMDKKLRKELKKAQEEVRHLPITNSLVRIVFNNPEPSLSDLKYLDEIV